MLPFPVINFTSQRPSVSVDRIYYIQSHDIINLVRQHCLSQQVQMLKRLTIIDLNPIKSGKLNTSLLHTPKVYVSRQCKFGEVLAFRFSFRLLFMEVARRILFNGNQCMWLLSFKFNYLFRDLRTLLVKFFTNTLREFGEVSVEFSVKFFHSNNMKFDQIIADVHPFCK